MKDGNVIGHLPARKVSRVCSLFKSFHGFVKPRKLITIENFWIYGKHFSHYHA